MGRFWRKLRQILADDRIVASLAERLDGLRQLTQFKHGDGSGVQTFVGPRFAGVVNVHDPQSLLGTPAFDEGRREIDQYVTVGRGILAASRKARIDDSNWVSATALC